MNLLVDMENSEAVCDLNGSVYLLNNGDVEERENPENDLLDDLDSYLEDINDRLTISRMVSDSVIKGMVNAVEQEATEKILQKEMELARLKETLHYYQSGVDGSESSGSLEMQHEPRSAEYGMHSSFSDVVNDCDGIRGSLESLNSVVKKQLKKLRKEIDRLRGSSSVRRMNSGSDMPGLGGILQDKVSDIRWMDVDKAFDSLKTTLDCTFKHVDNLVNMSNPSPCLWQQEKEFQGEIEDLVIMSCIRGLKQEFQERLWDQNARLYGSETINWLEKFKEISNLRHELDAISKSLILPEIGHITSYGSVEIIEDWDHNKRIDHLHRKVSGSHWEGNGNHDEAVIVPENLEFNQLKHMSKEELVSYFKTEMTKMKRNHEHRVQEMTEEYFSLRREYLKERGSSLPFKRDKEFDMLRKKIPEVILKLDGILVENEKLTPFSENAESLCSLRDRFETLFSENRQLKDLLAERKRDIKRLSKQVADDADIILQHSTVETNLLKKIHDLQRALEDVRFEALISADVYTCMVKGIVDSGESMKEQCEAYETILSEAARNAEPTNQCEIEDADMESIMMSEFCGIIFKEALKEAEEKLTDLSRKCIIEEEIRALSEIEAQQKEKALKLETAEKERLQNEILLLTSLTEEKDKLVKESTAALVKEKEGSQLIAQELQKLREEASQHEVLISESRRESNIIKCNLTEAMQQIEQYKEDAHELKQKLEMVTEELRNTNEEKQKLLYVSQQKQNAALLVEANESKHRTQMQSLIFIVQGLSKAFATYEYRIMEDIRKSNLRYVTTFSFVDVVVYKSVFCYP